MANKQLLFHFEFSESIGWGHAVRSSALAEAACQQGYTCTLFTQSDVNQLHEAILAPFARNVTTVKPSDYCAVIIDSHHHHAESIRTFWPVETKPTIVFDDECNRDLSFASLIINTALDTAHFKYSSEIPACLGARFALLRAPFAQCETNKHERSGTVIIMGGTDPLNLISRVVQGLVDSPLVAQSLSIIAPAKSESEAEIRKYLQHFPTSHWHTHASASDIANIFRNSQYGITACGNTPYELAACKAPFIGIQVSENQNYFCQAIEDLWGLPTLDGRTFSHSKFQSSLNKLFNSTPKFHAIDGRGAMRIVQTISKILE